MCNDDSCDLSHCAKCGSHMLGGYLIKGSICDSCSLQIHVKEELEKFEKNKKTDPHVVCTLHPEKNILRIYRNGNYIGLVKDEKIMLGETFFLTFNDIDIIQDNWNNLQEIIRLNKI